MAPASPLASLWPRYRRTLGLKQVCLRLIIVNICPEYTLTLIVQDYRSFLDDSPCNCAKQRYTCTNKNRWTFASEVIDVSEISWREVYFGVVILQVIYHEISTAMKNVTYLLGKTSIMHISLIGFAF